MIDKPTRFCALCSRGHNSAYYPLCAMCDPHGIVTGSHFTEEQAKALRAVQRLGGREGLFDLLLSWGCIRPDFADPKRLFGSDGWKYGFSEASLARWRETEAAMLRSEGKLFVALQDRRTP